VPLAAVNVSLGAHSNDSSTDHEGNAGACSHPAAVAVTIIDAAILAGGFDWSWRRLPSLEES
jgi:hypothetical protein